MRALIGILNVRTAAPPVTISKLFVEYNSTDFTYLTTHAGWTDTDGAGEISSFANVIELATLVPNESSPGVEDFCTGMCYDQSTDEFVVKRLSDASCLFFTRAAWKAAVAAGAGNIPTFTKELSTVGTQGITVDPINNIIFDYVSAGEIRESNKTTGAFIRSLGTDLPGTYDDGSLWYDYRTGKMYMTGTGGISLAVKVLEKNEAGTAWVTTETKWYLGGEGVGGSVISDLITMPTNRLTTRKADGTYITVIAMGNVNSATNGEGMLLDPRDNTLYWSEDSGGHVPNIVNGNRVWHHDPHREYLKLLRFPDMVRWTLWKTTGEVAGLYNEETLEFTDEPVSPVMDFVANTDQQTLANWTVPNGLALKFRGSASAPSTSPEDTVDYHTVGIYDANGTNSGWGSTTPGAWQETPVTNRYVQVKLVQVDPTVAVWSPDDISGILHYTKMYSALEGLYMDPADINRCDTALDLVNLAVADFWTNATAGQKPVWDPILSELQFNGGNRSYQRTNPIMPVGPCEVHVVGRRDAANRNCIYLSTCINAGSTNRITFFHSANSLNVNGAAGFTSAVGIKVIDNAGEYSWRGYQDTSLTNKLRTFRHDGTTLKIYENNAEQVLSQFTSAGVVGTNPNPWFSDITGPDRSFMGRETTAGGDLVAGIQYNKLFLITPLLSDSDRQELTDWCTDNGLI